MPKNTLKSKYFKRFLIGILFFILIIAVRFFGFHKMVTIEGFKLHREAIKVFVDHYYIGAVLIYIFSYATVVALSLPLALILTVIGGFLFGVTAGVVSVVIGGAIGASIAFLIARYVLRSTIQKKYERRLRKFNREMERYGVWYILGMHLLTVVPFFVINTFAAMTTIPFWKFFIVTICGVLPGALLYTFAGRELMYMQSVRDIFSPQVLLVLAVLSILTVITFCYRRYLAKKEGLI